MNKSAGHGYRIRFSLLLWVLLIYVFIAAPSSAAFVHNPNARFILLAATLLTVSFSIFTFIIWFAERQRSARGVRAK